MRSVSGLRVFPRFFLLLLLLCLAPQGFSAMQPVDDGWQYRWGDSPVAADGTPEWIQADASGQWQDIAFPSNPPDRQGREHVWFRVTLSEGEWYAPALYIYSVDIIVQVWFRGEVLYQYGTFDEQGRGRFEGWPWHEIPLPDDYEGETVYFRVFSNYTDIGLWGEVAILDHPDLVLHIVSNSAENLVVALISGLIALLSLVFAVIQRGQKSFASIALFSVVTALLLLAESQASLLIAYRPLFWDYLAAGSYFLVPVALALMLQQWLAEYRPVLIAWLWKLHLAFAAGALLLALAGLVDLSSVYPVFDGLLLVSLVLLVISAVTRFRHLPREPQVLLLACALFSVLLIADMAVAHGFIGWGRVPVSWGALLFSLAVVSISVWHYGRTQQVLRQLTVDLEQKVNERTARAEALAEREQARSRLLAVEIRKSRKLADVISELQDCPSLGPALGVLVGVLPELYQPLSGCFYQQNSAGEFLPVVSWGRNEGDPLDPGFPLTLGTDLSSLTETHLPVGSHNPDDHLCFFLRIEPEYTGQTPAGVLLLKAPELPEALKGYGRARMIAWVYQSVEKLGITLSGLALRDELQRFSYEDGLTGLKNRRHFDQLFRHEREVSARTGRPLSLVVFDLDCFKRFNDQHGHEAGDEALRTVGQLLASYFRGSDTVCRYGGEEFAVLLPGAPLAEARQRAEALRRLVAETHIRYQGADLGVMTLSGGVACWPETCKEFETLFRAADKALYRAKNTGRNRVVAAGN